MRDGESMQAGAPEAGAALAALRPLLLKLARLQLRNEAWAEDAVADTLVAALEGAPRFAGESQWRTWVVGILKHKIVDQLRRGLREPSLADPEDADDAAVAAMYRSDGHLVERAAHWGDPEAAAASAQFLAVLQACVERLPPALAQVFMMREWLELETPAVCKNLGITATNCHVMLHRARLRLRECLEVHWLAGAPR